MLLSFQNCSPGFQNQEDFLSSSSAPPPLSQGILKSHIFVGGPGYIKSYFLDHTTDAVTEMQTINLPGSAPVQYPGWMDYNSEAGLMFVADSMGGNLNFLNYDSSSGNLTLKKTVPFLSQVVHLNILKDGSDFLAFASGYNLSKYSRYRISPDLNNITVESSFQYAANAHTHSSTLDPVRNLAFVANKDENRIVIYSNATGNMQEISSVSLTGVRMLVYSPTYDRLYVTTEAYSGNSYVKIYSIQPGGGAAYSLQEESSFSMGLRGSDIKIDSLHNYAVATVREAGKEGIWALPLNRSGLLESARSPVFIPVAKLEARSLQISADGKYFIVTCNDASNIEDLLIYKVTYDSTNSIISTNLIQSVDVGPGYFYSNFILPRQ